jgi:DNA-binding CsgD family transcriptional regulator
LGWATLLRGDSERARALHTESLELRREVGDKPAASESLGALACVAKAQGEGKRAARLFGAAQMLREAIGMQQDPSDRLLQEPYLAAAHSQLDETAWETAWAEGRVMGHEEALEYALSEEGFIAVAPNVPENLAPDAQPPAALTPREGEIAALVVQGFTNRQIASELSISEHTVHRHVASILKKLDLHSREQVASRLAER